MAGPDNYNGNRQSQRQRGGRRRKSRKRSTASSTTTTSDRPSLSQTDTSTSQIADKPEPTKLAVLTGSGNVLSRTTLPSRDQSGTQSLVAPSKMRGSVLGTSASTGRAGNERPDIAGIVAAAPKESVVPEASVASSNDSRPTASSVGSQSSTNLNKSPDSRSRPEGVETAGVAAAAAPKMAKNEAERLPPPAVARSDNASPHSSKKQTKCAGCRVA